MNKGYTFGMFLGEELERRLARQKRINKIVAGVSLALAFLGAIAVLVWIPVSPFAQSMWLEMHLQTAARLPSAAHPE